MSLSYYFHLNPSEKVPATLVSSKMLWSCLVVSEIFFACLHTVTMLPNSFQGLLLTVFAYTFNTNPVPCLSISLKIFFHTSYLEHLLKAFFDSWSLSFYTRYQHSNSLLLTLSEAISGFTMRQIKLLQHRSLHTNTRHYSMLLIFHSILKTRPYLFSHQGCILAKQFCSHCSRLLLKPMNGAGDTQGHNIDLLSGLQINCSSSSSKHIINVLQEQPEIQLSSLKQFQGTLGCPCILLPFMKE